MQASKPAAEGEKKTTAKLVILRHGQTHYNRAHLMTGRHDIKLTSRGRAQAREAGRILKYTPIDKVYSSYLQRAFNTASLALKHAGKKDLPIEKRYEIIETDAGDFTGRCYTDDPEMLAHKPAYGKPMPNGESDKDVVARVRKFYDEKILPHLSKGESVMVVAHYGVACAFDIVLGIVPEPEDCHPCHEARVPNAAPAIYSYEDGVMVSHTYIENRKSQPRVLGPVNKNEKQDKKEWRSAPKPKDKGPGL